MYSVPYFHLVVQHHRKDLILEAKRKKKKSKTTKVTILLVDPSKGLPKNKCCRELKENGYEEVIGIKRNMSSVAVRKAISSAFQFSETEFRILCVKRGKSVVDTNQKPTGGELVEIVTKRKSPMYI